MVLTPSYHVFRMYVPFQDSTFVPVTVDAGTYAHGDVSLAACRCDRGQGYGRQALAGRDQSRCQPPCLHRGKRCRHHAEMRRRRDPHRAAGRQRSTPSRHPILSLRSRSRRRSRVDDGRADARAQVGDGDLGGAVTTRGLALIAGVSIGLGATNASAGSAKDDSTGPVSSIASPRGSGSRLCRSATADWAAWSSGGARGAHPAERGHVLVRRALRPDQPEALQYLPKVRQLIREGRYKEAQDLADEKLMGRPRHLQAYQPSVTCASSWTATTTPPSIGENWTSTAPSSASATRIGDTAYTREVF